VGRVDEDVEAFFCKGTRKTLGPSKAAAADAPWESRGLGSLARERDGHVVAFIAMQRASESSRLAAAAKNEKLQDCHAAIEVAL
jgi:hypothetical protein